MNNKGIINYFADMKDPRIDRTKRHKLIDILFISIASVLSGAESWEDMEEYGQYKIEWLKTFLELPNGIPSHDTFNRVYKLLDSQMFEQCFLKWIESIFEKTSEEIISIDGKTIRGSRGLEVHSAIHIVSAWAEKNNMVLGQIKVDQKSNEITAIPKLLDALMVQGSIITIDAIGCQKEIAKKIISKGADYILSVKENQKDILEDIEDSFKMIPATTISESLDSDHGRVETRKCSVLNDLSLVDKANKWMGLKSIIKIERERYFKSTAKTENETSYYISSLTDADTIANGIRKHWGVENKLHWVLDVAFNEDHSRKRTGNAAENFSILNRIALNLLKTCGLKVGIKSRRKIAGWNNDFVLKLLKI